MINKNVIGFSFMVFLFLGSCFSQNNPVEPATNTQENQNIPKKPKKPKKIKKSRKGKKQVSSDSTVISTSPPEIILGIDQMVRLDSLLKGKRVGVVANQTSILSKSNTHLVDTLLRLNIAVSKVFSPEHGFRGKASAGESVASGIDSLTGLSVVSLYGNHKKPTPEDLQDMDVLVFDLQDVGVRFYTYISTMHYVMEACAENNIPLLILDRPNPNGFYVDGPILKPEFRSFVGFHPIPVVHGLTVGELANMINAERWLADSLQCNTTIIPCLNYSHKDYYNLKVSPSPNLPTPESIYLYPSLCFFEGTDISVGRGTDKPFQIIGSPILDSKEFRFTPVNMEHAKDPKQMDKLCNGYDLTTFGSFYFKESKGLYWYWLVNTYKEYKQKEQEFFTRPNFFDLLAGTSELRELVLKGASPEEISLYFKPEVDAYKVLRKKYLLYADFE